MVIRQAKEQDVSRIAEILVFNNRVNFYPIFRDDEYSFGELQVVTLADQYREDKAALENTYVYDDGVVRGLIRMENGEIKKLFVDTFFQRRGIGGKLMEFAINEKQANRLWALEKNTGAIRFYERYGFRVTGEKKYEEGTTEYLIELERR
ncbi:MAG: GNAT family N-acetyltransferase [Lachnospiraceae bacterium]|nr:GNAT family N-acetyltransferase [Lachnospiraceae bacterium]